MQTENMVDITLTIPTITLTMNGLNIPIQREWKKRWQKQQLLCCKEHYQESEKTIHRMGENTCKSHI